MPLVNDRCICMRRVEYSETSQVLTLFGRQQGVVHAIAKGAHRVTKTGAGKFGGGVDLMDVGEATLIDSAEKDLATLTEWKLQEGHRPLRSRLRGIYLGFYACELVSLLLERHDPHPRLFDHMERLFVELAGEDAEREFVRFELELLREAGFLPELNRCVSCGRQANARSLRTGRPVSFDSEAGGILCRECEAGHPHRAALDSRLLLILQELGHERTDGDVAVVQTLSRADTDPINRLLGSHAAAVAGNRLRVQEWVV